MKGGRKQIAKAAAEKQDGCLGLRAKVLVKNQAKTRNYERIYICKNENTEVTTGTTAGTSKEKSDLCTENGSKCLLKNCKAKIIQLSG